MKIGIPKEPEAEKRVAMVPDVIPKLTKNGFEIVVEDGLGNSAGFSNEEYSVKGANVTTRNEVMDSEIIMSISKLARLLVFVQGNVHEIHFRIKHIN